jgi:hypothetical protein
VILSNRETHGPASQAPEFTEVIMCHPADEPPHVTDGTPCWCHPDIQGMVVIHKTLTQVANEMREWTLQALGGEDPGGDYQH